MAVISLADLHIGALSWGPETGSPYDVAIAERLAGEAMALNMLRKIAVWNPERILFILGNDLLHTDKTIDGKGGSTTRGTIQEGRTADGSAHLGLRPVSMRLQSMQRGSWRPLTFIAKRATMTRQAHSC